MAKDQDERPDEIDEEAAPAEADGETGSASDVSDDPELRRRAKARARRKKHGLQPAPLPRSETAIDSPRWVGITMMAMVVVPTITIWGWGRVMCNIRGADPTQPKEVSLEKLTETPKGAAIEFRHRVATYDYATALKLAEGDVAAAVTKLKAECDQQGDACTRKRQSAEAHVRTTAVLETAAGDTAEATVTEHRKDARRRFKVQLARKQGRWKVVAQTPI